MSLKVKRKTSLGTILLVGLVLTSKTIQTKEIEPIKHNNATSYFEGSVLVTNERSNFRSVALKNEFEKLQNEIESLKVGQENIQNLLNEILRSSKTSSSSSSTLSRAPSNQFDEHPQLYDQHFNCLKNCTTLNRSENCADVMPGNQHKFGIYLLSVPPLVAPFYAYCRLDEENKQWTIIQRRIDGSVNFYRNWHDYKNGFGDLYGEYWLGLARLHAMTAHRHYELWIYLSDFDYNEKSLYYGRFSVGSEAEGYALHVSGYIGDIEDSLKHNNGRQFSAYDHFEYENVYNSLNCAQTYKGAWWYYDCFSCSLNGEFFSHSNRRTRYGIFWRDWHGYESLRSAHMAIRSVQ